METIIPYSYDPVMVAASVLVAIMASFTGLRLASGLKLLSARARKVQIVKAAFALGGGIWSMHFVGMLAVELPVRITYDALYTLGSVLLSILITGLGLALMQTGERGHLRTAVAGALAGLGIVSMHYVGMAAIGGNCRISYLPGGTWISSAIAIVASIGALRLAYHRRTLVEMSLAGVILGITISAMHYSAMAFTQFLPVAELARIAAPVIEDGYLALFVALAAFVVCGVFLLTALPIERTGWSGAAALAAGLGVVQPAGRTAVASDREVRPDEARDETAVRANTTDGLRLPYEQNNTTYFVNAERVAAIRADGHYTRLLDGQDSLFCPWSITKLEAYLSGGLFMRTHRSFLVNLRHARAFQRKKDKAYLVVAGLSESPVPISRSHVADVRRALGI